MRRSRGSTASPCRLPPPRRIICQALLATDTGSGMLDSSSVSCEFHDHQEPNIDRSINYPAHLPGAEAAGPLRHPEEATARGATGIATPVRAVATQALKFYQ